MWCLYWRNASRLWPRVFMFDNSQNHAKAPDALCANNLNLSDGGKNTKPLSQCWVEWPHPTHAARWWAAERNKDNTSGRWLGVGILDSSKITWLVIRKENFFLENFLFLAQCIVISDTANALFVNMKDNYNSAKYSKMYLVINTRTWTQGYLGFLNRQQRRKKYCCLKG